MRFPNETLFVEFFTGKPLKDLHFERGILVGSSGHVLQERRGERIEKFDTIFRMNNAPGGGKYAPYVGKRTDVRVCAHSAINNIGHLLKNLRYLFIWGPKENYVKIANVVKRYQVAYPNLRIYRLTDRAIKLNDAEFAMKTGKERYSSGSWLSTGWFAIFIMINLCKGMTVCGLGCLRDSKKKIPYHYWDNLHGSETDYMVKQQQARKGHRFLTEMQIFYKWGQIYEIKYC